MIDTPLGAKKFEKYAAMEALPIIQLYSSKYKTTDIIFITSEGTHEIKSKSVKQKQKILVNWRRFL